jgi:flagellar basal-body rod protein FlgB
MLGSMTDSTTVGLLEKLAIFGERRQELLAGNIANIDTPGYNPRDLPVADFQQALKDVVSARQSPNSLNAGMSSLPNSSQRLLQMFPEEMFRAVETQGRNITFQDGATRSIETEVMEMSKNAMMQRFAVELMSAQMGMLQAVISERV